MVKVAANVSDLGLVTPGGKVVWGKYGNNYCKLFSNWMIILSGKVHRRIEQVDRNWRSKDSRTPKWRIIPSWIPMVNFNVSSISCYAQSKLGVWRFNHHWRMGVSTECYWFECWMIIMSYRNAIQTLQGFFAGLHLLCTTNSDPSPRTARRCGG